MSKNELEKLWQNDVVLSYRDKMDHIRDFLLEKADGENIIGTGTEVEYAPGLWEYKHSFAEDMYVREMRMKKGQICMSVIHKRSYPLFLLTGKLAITTETGIEEFIAPVYFVSPEGGTQRIAYAIEDCIIVTVHQNPMNTKELKELEKYLYAFTWEEYDEFVNKTKKDEKNK